MNIVQIYKRFPTNESCIEHLENIRWNGNPKCPYCNSLRVTPNGHRYHCNVCNTAFSVTVRTIFHKTKVDLQKWFLSIALVLETQKSIPARELAHKIEVDKNTAWYILTRIKKNMENRGNFLKSIRNW